MYKLCGLMTNNKQHIYQLDSIYIIIVPFTFSVSDTIQYQLKRIFLVKNDTIISYVFSSFIDRYYFHLYLYLFSFIFIFIFGIIRFLFHVFFEQVPFNILS